MQSEDHKDTNNINCTKNETQKAVDHISSTWSIWSYSPDISLYGAILQTSTLQISNRIIDVLV